MGAEEYFMPVIIIIAEIFFICFSIWDIKIYDQLTQYVTDTSLIKRKNIFKAFMLGANVILIISMIMYVYYHNQYDYFWNIYFVKNQVDINIKASVYHYEQLCEIILVICGVLDALCIIDVILMIICNKKIKALRKKGDPVPEDAAVSAPEFCSNCGEPIQPDSNFCVKCGTARPQSQAAVEPQLKAPEMNDMWICEKCGTENSHSFCKKCGTARPQSQAAAEPQLKAPETDDMWICKECGTENKLRFCVKCGTARSS